MTLKLLVDKGWNASNRYAAASSEKRREKEGLSL